MAYPTNLDSIPQPGSNSLTTSPSHAGTHDLEIIAIQAIEAKLGIGASTAVSNTVLRGTGTGTTAFAQVGLTTDVTGTLPVLNGGTGVTTSTGAGNVVLSTSPAITTPTGIVKGDVGLGNVDNTSDVTKNAAAVTLTNKTIDASQLVAATVTAAKMQFGMVRQRQGGTTGDATWQTTGTSNTDTSAKGVFIQTGSVACSSGAVLLTFPVAFTQVPMVFAQTSSAGTANVWTVVKTITTSTCIIYQITSAGAGATTETANWMAIGQ